MKYIESGFYFLFTARRHDLRPTFGGRLEQQDGSWLQLSRAEGNLASRGRLEVRSMSNGDGTLGSSQ